MKTRPSWLMLVVCAVGALAAACTAEIGDPVPDEDSVDDGAFLTFEADAFAALDATGEMAAVETAPFERLGLLWDSAAASSYEVRTSADGDVWSAWAAPVVADSDETSHVGYVDTDAPASFFQLRVLDPGAPPSFVAAEPKATIPIPMWTGEGSLPDTADADDMSLEPVAPEGSIYFTVSSGIGSLTIHPRSEWGARAPKCEAWTTPYRATIHHTDTPTSDSLSVPARLRQIQAYHMFTNGWCDIGYNFLISRDGRAWRGRGARHLGAHTLDNNTGNVGVSFIGTYTSTTASSTQKCTAAKMLRWLHGRFPALDLNRTDVKGHRQYGATSCPGGALYNQIDGILSMAKNGC